MKLERMRVAGVGSLLFVLTIAGCGTKPSPPAQVTTEPPKAAPQAAVESAAPAVPPATSPSPPPASPQLPAVTHPPIAAAQPAEGPTVPPAAPAASENVAKAVPKAPSVSTPAPAPAAQPAKPAAAPSDTAKPQAAPPLDLDSLETRLKETKAIGVMTKLSLKNQVDDLLNQFRAFYAGKLKTTLAELRRPFDLLILKVLSLLQDNDPSLAAAIVASREAIWGILSDPAKFAKLASN